MTIDLDSEGMDKLHSIKSAAAFLGGIFGINNQGVALEIGAPQSQGRAENDD
jgi:hypothetical protein